jgi:putative flippase GtrA
MSDLSRRPSYTPRRTREQRAYRLVLVGGAAGAVAVVGFVLAIAGVIGIGIPLLAAVVAVVALVLFRSTVSSGR